MLNGILFEYSYTPGVMKLSSKASKKLGLPRTIIDDYKPRDDEQSKASIENLEKIKKILRRQTAPKEKPTLIKQAFNIDGKSTPCNVKVLQIWTKGQNEVPVLTSMYGHIDIIQ